MTYQEITAQVQWFADTGHITDSEGRFYKYTEHVVFPDKDSAENYLTELGWEKRQFASWRHPNESYSVARVRRHEEANRDKWK